MSHKPGGRLPLLSARSAVTLATFKLLVFDDHQINDRNDRNFDPTAFSDQSDDDDDYCY